MSDDPHGPPPEEVPPMPEAIAEYHRRCCVVCGARQPSFGFGPPLTRPGGEVWACRDHRQEVATRFAKLTAPGATDPPQKGLF